MKNDLRSKKIALVAHCVLNQNAVVGGLSRYPAVIPGVFETLKAHDFSIVQLPCPEMYAAGLDRWGQVKEQYANSGFKRSFQEAAEVALTSVEDYVSHGYKIVIIGIEGSPSCGITLTESNPDWGGTLTDAKDESAKLISARGTFMDVLFEKIRERGWIPFPAIGLSSNTEGNSSSIKPLEDFLTMFD